MTLLKRLARNATPKTGNIWSSTVDCLWVSWNVASSKRSDIFKEYPSPIRSTRMAITSSTFMVRNQKKTGTGRPRPMLGKIRHGSYRYGSHWRNYFLSSVNCQWAWGLCIYCQAPEWIWLWWILNMIGLGWGFAFRLGLVNKQKIINLIFTNGTTDGVKKILLVAGEWSGWILFTSSTWSREIWKN